MAPKRKCKFNEDWRSLDLAKLPDNGMAQCNLCATDFSISSRGVTAGHAPHNSSNVGGVTAGQARHKLLRRQRLQRTGKILIQFDADVERRG